MPELDPDVVAIVDGDSGGKPSIIPSGSPVCGLLISARYIKWIIVEGSLFFNPLDTRDTFDGGRLLLD